MVEGRRRRHAWNALTYDPEFNRVYIGTGNGGPWNRKIRSPGGGDNLFLCSIVALDADTGRYVWHYQTTPGETWDYNSSMDITLADAADRRQAAPGDPARAEERLLLCHRSQRRQAALGREVRQGHLGGTRRSCDRPAGRDAERALRERRRQMWPSTMGVHNWQPMSFNAATGLVYIPDARDDGLFDDTGVTLEDYKVNSTQLNVGLKPMVGGDAPKDAGKSALLAWDPARAETGLEPADARFLERRHDDDRRRTRLPGPGRRPHQRL